MNSKLITFVLLMVVGVSMFAQQPLEKRAYYDWAETKLKAVYTTLPDGTEHGPYKIYYETGNLQFSGLMMNGIPREMIAYLPDGKVFINTKYNAEKLFEGPQESYGFDDNMQNRFLKQTANITNGVVTSFKTFNSDGSLSWTYEEKGGKKTYREYENKVPVIDLSFESNNLTGHIRDEVKFSNNEIISLAQEGRSCKREGQYLFIDDGEWERHYSKKYNTPVDIVAELPTSVDNADTHGMTFLIKLSVVTSDSERENICKNSYDNDRKLYDLSDLTNHMLDQYRRDSTSVRKVDGLIETEEIYKDNKLVSLKEFKGENGQLSFEAKDNLKTWFNNENKIERQEIYNGEQLVSIKKFLGKDGQLSYDFTGSIETWYNDLNQIEKQDFHVGDKVIAERKFNNGVICYSDTTMYNIEINGLKRSTVKQIQLYDDTGRLTREEIKQIPGGIIKFKVLNSEGEITDSDDLQKQLNQLKTEIEKTTKSIIKMYGNSLKLMASKFNLNKNGVLVNGKSGEQIVQPIELGPQSIILNSVYSSTKSLINPEDYNKKISNIYEGVQICYHEFLKSILEYDKNLIGKYENAEPAVKENSVSGIIAWRKDYSSFLNDLEMHIMEFQAMMDKAYEKATGPETSTFDKGLKKVTDPAAVKSIMGLLE